MECRGEHDWELVVLCTDCDDGNCCVQCAACLIEDCYCANS